MTVAARLDLSFTQGTDYVCQLEFVNLSGVAVPVTGYTAWAAEVRRHRDRTSGLLGAFAFDTSQAAAGIILMTMAKAVTVLLPPCAWWDLDVTDPSGNRVSLLVGEVSVPRDVTVPAP